MVPKGRAETDMKAVRGSSRAPSKAPNLKKKKSDKTPRKQEQVRYANFDRSSFLNSLFGWGCFTRSEMMFVGPRAPRQSPREKHPSEAGSTEEERWAHLLGHVRAFVNKEQNVWCHGDGTVMKLTTILTTFLFINTGPVLCFCVCWIGESSSSESKKMSQENWKLIQRTSVAAVENMMDLAILWAMHLKSTLLGTNKIDTIDWLVTKVAFSAIIVS